MEHILKLIEYLVFLVEIFGILLIVGGMLFAFLRYALPLGNNPRTFECLRKELGRALLLGLEVLVAGDIIETVLIEPSLNRVAALGIIVIIRTILSLSIEMEISGQLPWRGDSKKETNKKEVV